MKKHSPFFYYNIILLSFSFFLSVNGCGGEEGSTGSDNGEPKDEAKAGVIISQIYPGGGNSGAKYQEKYIVLHNHGTAAANLTGWVLQYASATGSFSSSSLYVNLSGEIPPGKYYLVKLTSGSGGDPLPVVPDLALHSITPSGTTGKFALVKDTLLTGANPNLSSPHIIDFLGYGTSATWYEGTGPATAPSSTTGIIRKSGGCQDTNDNANDFELINLADGTNLPKNSLSPGCK